MTVMNPMEEPVEAVMLMDIYMQETLLRQHQTEVRRQNEHARLIRRGELCAAPAGLVQRIARLFGRREPARRTPFRRAQETA